MQEQRPEKEQEMLKQWESHFKSLYGHTGLFALAYQKAIYEYDMYGKIPSGLESLSKDETK